MNKIELYQKILDDKTSANFLEGLIYLDEFSFFYQLVLELEAMIEVLPSFTYNDVRESLSETMREIKFKTSNIEEVKLALDKIKSIETLKYGFDYICDPDGVFTLTIA